LCRHYTLCENTFDRRPIFRILNLPRWLGTFQRASYSCDRMSEQDKMQEGFFSYREGKEMFSWYETDQIVGLDSWYAWGGVTAGAVLGEAEARGIGVPDVEVAIA